EAELVVIQVKDGKEFRHPVGYSGEGTDAERAANPQFSLDNSYVLFLISPTQEDVKKAKKEKKKEDEKPKKKLGIMDLSTGEATEIERVKDFKLPEKVGGIVAYHLEEPLKAEKKEEPEAKKEEEPKKKEEKAEEEKDKKDEKKRKYGTKLILRMLKTGEEKEFDAVMEYLLTKDGKNLFYIVSDKEKPERDGVYTYYPYKDQAITLMSGKGVYKGVTFNKEETVAAFLTDRDDQEAKEPTYNLYGWHFGDQMASLWVSHTTTANFPEGMAVSDKSPISFNEDGRIVMFGIKEIPEPKNDEENTENNEEGEGTEEEEKAKFDLWHWADPYPQPQQKKMTKEVKENTWESVYFIDTKSFVKLADEELPDVSLSRNGKIAFGQTVWPYAKKVSYDGTYQDVYVVEPATGKKTLVTKEHYGYAQLSPNGKYVFWFAGKDWFVYDIASKAVSNLSEKLDVSFQRHDWDTPNPPHNYGYAGWTDDDTSILIYDQFDIWEIKPDGSDPRLITEGVGRKNGLTFRYVRLDPEEETIPLNKDLLLETLHEDTMAGGFYKDTVNGTSQPEKLIMVAKSFGRPHKAKNSNKLMFTRAAFDEYPDLWVGDTDFKNLCKVTDLGKQMETFIWGREELRNFYSVDGKPLKGILVKPDNFEPDKKYPLMVYIYETLHQGFHRYRHPSPGSSINPSYYVSNEYILWMPDIEYDTGYPGKDALKCVLPGIHMLIREGYIDPEAIGIQGHSWGGYQIAYMITQTNIFAAVEAGAPVSNMTSAYGGIRWGSGMVRQFQYERTQSRLGGSLWEVPLRYIENSPLFWADKVETPIMMMHNDEDGAVPWYQGIEYIMALRRLGKEAYMFNYNGEDHGLRKRVNQIDWTIRLAEFFDHHLKGAKIPDWMKNGIQAWDKDN
ncbi:MAG: S9 family peptidase, partial [Candidatus Aminicenantes bacterium]|nr:S9 family peptidase [Candidatus Aminicenantes bacterium]